MGVFEDMGISKGKDRINEEVAYNIARAYTLLDNHMSRFFLAHKLSPAKFNILMMVKHIGLEKGAPQNEISKRLLVTISNISRMIEKLRKDGCVERLSQAGDRRVNLIRITKKGSDLLDAVWPQYKEKIDSLIGPSFSAGEKRSLNGLLEKFIVASMRGA